MGGGREPQPPAGCRFLVVAGPTAACIWLREGLCCFLCSWAFTGGLWELDDTVLWKVACENSMEENGQVLWGLPCQFQVNGMSETSFWGWSYLNIENQLTTSYNAGVHLVLRMVEGSLLLTSYPEQTGAKAANFLFFFSPFQKLFPKRNQSTFLFRNSYIYTHARGTFPCEPKKFLANVHRQISSFGWRVHQCMPSCRILVASVPFPHIHHFQVDVHNV